MAEREEIKTHPGFIFKKSATDDTRRKVRSWEAWLAEPSTFTLDYPRTVSFMVKVGKATLVPLLGNEVMVSEGDFVRIDSGAKITWTVTETIVNKFCYHDSYQSSELYRAKKSESI